jgi:hypothetical protein
MVDALRVVVEKIVLLETLHPFVVYSDTHCCYFNICIIYFYILTYLSPSSFHYLGHACSIGHVFLHFGPRAELYTVLDLATPSYRLSVTISIPMYFIAMLCGTRKIRIVRLSKPHRT